MYPQIDETLEKVLKENNHPLLSKFKITLLTRKWETEPHCIMIMHTSDDPKEDEDTYDSERRSLEYIILIKTTKIDDLAYLDAMKELGKISYVIKKILRKSKDMVYTNEGGKTIDLRQGLQIGQIVPEFVNYVIKSSQMKIIIPVDEIDIETLDNEFESITSKDTVKWES
ncbi:hypothetical protein MBCUT_06830 [Methanobrevibacter cuticularis]|uniref:Uncharacterized protein n=1 Tax=Methanobrevibacter cuticularis TaxID=47311 RepID=A0A166EGZ6_9EURY|nr:hypothetical protein [Methanobrevibacter cuticularis]KZX16645.1 hypothetical protein MBCUT_06830 [Methanobrevibacter cuticularis]